MIAIGILAVMLMNNMMPVSAASIGNTIISKEKTNFIETNEESEITEQDSSELVNQYIIADTNIVLDYVISEEKVEITGCNTDAKGGVQIPEKIEGYSVEVIRESAFCNCKEISEVNIPDSVMTIGANAFESCELMTSITLSNNLVNLDKAVFKNCHVLQEISLPDSLTYIPDETFAGCWELRDIEFPEYMTMIGNQAFERCVVLNSVIIPEGVKKIGNKAFAQCGEEAIDGYNFKSVTLPSTIQSIGEYAFSNCSSLKTINLPEGLTSIEKGAFSFCYSLESVRLPNTLKEISTSIFGQCRGLKEVQLPENLTSIPDGMFASCYSLSQIKIPETVQSIGKTAFLGCTLKVIEFPKELKEIGERAFEDCINLVKLELPDNLKILGNGAFKNCSLLTSVKIPNGVTSISGTFEKCTSLKEVFLPSNLVYLGDRTFAGCLNLIKVEIPETVEELGVNAFLECSGLENLELSENITKIGAGAFTGCKGILEFTLPDGLTEISDNLFSGCKFSSIQLPNKITRIGSAAFANCSNLVELTIPSGVTELGNNAFYKCNSLVQIVLPETITKIGYAAFSECTELNTIDLPDGIEEIENLTFNNCTGLKNVFLPEKLVSIGYEAFLKCSSLQNIVLPKTLKRIDEQAFKKSGILELYIPDSISEIDTYCLFEYCAVHNLHLPSNLNEIGWRMFANSGIVNVSIPENVTVITAEAFNAALQLVHVDLPENLKSLEREAFGYCTKLTEVCFHGNAPQEIAGDSFLNVDATVYYPLENESWTEEKRQNYGGNLTWVACEPELMPKPSVEVGDPIVLPKDEGIIYEVDDSTETAKVKICSIDTEGVITIAENIEGYPVTEIAEGAFENCDLITALILPESLACIDKKAFAKCEGLNVIRFQGEAPKISENAFAGVNAAVHYPEQKSSWTEEMRKDYGGKLIWYGYGKSEQIPKPGDSGTYKSTDSNTVMTYTIDAKTGEAEILSCNKNAEGTIVIPSNIGGYPITKIKDYAFQQSDIENVELSEGIKTLGEGVFYFCKKIKSVKLPEKSLTEIADGAFYGCSNLTEIYIPDSVIRIGISAFARCTALNQVRMPKVLEILDLQAFSYCKSLEKIIVPKGVACISEEAFYECTKLATITIPATVKSIGEQAFYQNTALTDIYFDGTKNQWNEIMIANGNTQLNNATVHVKEALEITVQPENQYVKKDENAIFQIQASGEGLTYRWQYSTSGKYWFDSGMAGANTESLTVKALEKRDGQRYRCVITDAYGVSLTSAVVVLTLEKSEPIIMIIKQPEDQNELIGEDAVFEVEAVGEHLSYRWQYSASGKYWFDSGMEGADTATLNVKVVKKRNGQQYRCVLTDNEGNILISNAAVLRVKNEILPISIQAQPGNQIVPLGEMACFCVTAEGNELSYQWQYSNNGGKYWYNSGMSGANSEMLEVPATSKRNGQQYRCVIIDESGNKVMTDVAMLVIEEIR